MSNKNVINLKRKRIVCKTTAKNTNKFDSGDDSDYMGELDDVFDNFHINSDYESGSNISPMPLLPRKELSSSDPGLSFAAVIESDSSDEIYPFYRQRRLRRIRRPPVMSFSIKYDANQEEIKNIFAEDAPAPVQNAPSNADDVNKLKKNEKSGSLINKYFKSFKSADKCADDDTKTETELPKDNIEKKSLDTRNESGGSPIKEYLSKFNKRNDSIDTSSDIESFKEKDSSISNDRWKLFSDFKFKIAQAVEDIKSRGSESTDTKDKSGSIDYSNVTDSEDNSLNQDVDLNSTDNQVSSLASSLQNLSELSPPIISHSSTMTDMDMETNSSDTNNILTETLEPGKKQYNLKNKIIHYDDSDDDDQLEIESGVDALEDAELVLQNDSPVSPSPTHHIIVKPPETLIIKDVKKPAVLFSYSLMAFSTIVLSSIVIFPTVIMFNGFLIGIWFTYFLNKLYTWILELLNGNDHTNTPIRPDHLPICQNTLFNKMPYIVEFEPLKKHEGWINVFMLGNYSLKSYHISLTQTAFMKLEGNILRLSFTHNKVPKRALWDEALQKVPFFQHRIYNLEGAKVMLLPLGIVKKRYWSKKYPICIVFKDKSKMTVYNAKSSDSGNKNVSVDAPNLPLYSNDDVLKEAEKDSNISSASVEIKSSTDKDEKKSKESPRKTLGLFEKKTDKLTPGSPKRNEVSNQDSTKTISNQKVGVKGKKDALNNEDKAADTISPESESSPILKEKQNIVNSDVVTEAVINEEFFDPSKDILNCLDDENSANSMSNTDILSNEWIKDDFVYSDHQSLTLYLFGRTGREKDEWFHRLKSAIEDASRNQISEVDQSINQQDEDDLDVTQNLEPYDSLGDELSKIIASQKDGAESKVKLGNIKSEKKLIGGNEAPSVLWTPSGSIKESPLVNKSCFKQDIEFWQYMRHIIETKNSPDETDTKLSYDVLWFNALFSRIIFDTFRNDVWVTMVQERIQKKLSSLKLPTFMGPLVVSALKFGGEVPKIHCSSNPTLDARGLWVDLKVTYDGLATMTLTTQLNLMSLIDKQREEINEETDEQKTQSPQHMKNSHAVYHSDLDDTAESSSEDEAVLVQIPIVKTDADGVPLSPSNVGNSSAKKIMRYVDKIASNKYFQHVTEYKYVKRAMEGVSNTDLKLSVDVCGVAGILAINIPPPPSDRIWFGFRGNPQLLLKAKPVVGSRVINFTHVTNWIEKKLCREFEKLLVLPNMEDIYLDCMMAPAIE